ncbi:MAG: Ig-like domain-containing protein [Gemmatimonadaceae bacterium]
MRLLTKQLAGIGAVVIALACANRAQQPPGGVIDLTPPHVESITPESGSVSQRAGAVTFRFSKVVSDQTSRGQLNQYFLISPSDGEPRVNWHRTHIDVRPRHGFRPNTAYAVTLLPGLADVRGNSMKEAVATVFSTGATLPQFGITGTIFDWAAERPASGAIVEAISRPDSVLYLAAADSLGQYTLGPFEAGRYTLVGFIDKNANRALDPGEIWDSTTVLITRSRPIVELLALTRDTIPPRMSGITRDDSVTIRVTFDRPLDPNQALSAGLFRVQHADSSEIRLDGVIGARAAQDSAARRDSTRRDSAAARPDTTRRDATAPSRVPPSVVPIPVPGRPSSPQAVNGRPSVAAPPLAHPSRTPPETMLLLKLAPPTVLESGATYRITARGVRSIGGHSAISSRTLTIPKPPPPTARDSARLRDSTRARPVTPPPRRPPNDNRSRRTG